MYLFVEADVVLGDFRGEGESSEDYGIHPREPGVTVADYVRTNSSLPRHIPFKNFWSCDVIFWVISATCSLCYIQCLRCEWVIISGFPPLMYPSSNWSRYLHCSHG